MLTSRRKTVTNIKPIEIDASEPLFSTFGAHEAEVAAMWIIRFCQYRKSWEPFLREDIQDFYENHGGQGDFHFCCLIDMCDTDVYHVMAETSDKVPWIPQIKDDLGQFIIPDEFVEKAYAEHERLYDRHDRPQL